MGTELPLAELIAQCAVRHYLSGKVFPSPRGGNPPRAPTGYTPQRVDGSGAGAARRGTHRSRRGEVFPQSDRQAWNEARSTKGYA